MCNPPVDPTAPANKMDIRTYIAAQAMQAIIAKLPPLTVLRNEDTGREAAVACGAVVYADSLIAELNRNA